MYYLYLFMYSDKMVFGQGLNLKCCYVEENVIENVLLKLSSFHLRYI